MLDYYFLGLTYIIVYVGAIAILFLFVIMLLQTDTNPISKGWSVNSMMFILYLVIAVAVAMGLTID